MSDVPQNYTNFNARKSKNPVLVVQIQGVKDLLTLNTLNTQILYGDPGIIYGGAGVIYGGLRPYSIQNLDGSISTFRPILSLKGSSLSISQRLEPEQGKASVSIMGLAFIDYQQYMTRLISSGGGIVPEILGREVRVFLGFTQISYPQDFFELFRGYISGVEEPAGLVVFQLSDPNLKRRQMVFFMGATTVTVAVGAGDMTIFVVSNEDFFAQIEGPDGDFYPSVGDAKAHCYIKIEDEWIECQPTPTFTDRFTVIQRGVRGTTAAAHVNGSDVVAGIQLGEATNPQNAIDMALQVMLSGWDGPWISEEPLLAIGPDPDPAPFVTTTQLITLPNFVDAVKDYGLVEGDFFILTGSSFGGNNGVYFRISRFGDQDGQTNRLIYAMPTDLLTKEQATPATVSFRSQYDVLPVGAGLRLNPKDVDVVRHLYVKNTFLGSAGNDLIFFLTETQTSGKDWLEKQVYLPVGAYSLSRRGKISCGYHSPPIANQQVFFLGKDNLLNPAGIRPSRSLNSRTFFNQIQISYNFDDDGTSRSRTILADIDSIQDPQDGGIGLTSTLQIEARGVYGGYSAALLQKRAFFLLSRYKRGALTIPCEVNWEVGSVIEAGDICVFDDPDVLQIANFKTGQRGLDDQLFEVIDKTFDIASGKGTLKLVGGVGATSNDRFATISPSSLLDTGSTPTQLIIKDSFGAVFPGNESKKWRNYVGLPVVVHSKDWVSTTTVTLLSVDPSNNNLLNVSSLGFSPPADYVIDIAPYPTGADPTENALYKVMHVFWSPHVQVATGVSTTQFTVAPGDVAKFTEGNFVRVHTEDYSSDSGDLTVTDITGVTITVSASMGFTPNSTFFVDLIGFPDGGESYRWI